MTPSLLSRGKQQKHWTCLNYSEAETTCWWRCTTGQVQSLQNIPSLRPSTHLFIFIFINFLLHPFNLPSFNLCPDQGHNFHYFKTIYRPAKWHKDYYLNYGLLVPIIGKVVLLVEFLSRINFLISNHLNETCRKYHWIANLMNLMWRSLGLMFSTTPLIQNSVLGIIY